MPRGSPTGMGKPGVKTGPAGSKRASGSIDCARPPVLLHMNTPAPFPEGQPAPLPARSPAAPAPSAEPAAQPSAESRWQLEIDLAGLREREANLRAYEARLRAWQEQLDGSGRLPPMSRSAAPFFGSAAPMPLPDDFELRTGWEKLHRARAILEAEQKQLRDDRLVLRDLKADLERREQELAQRDAAVHAREQQLAVTPAVPPPAEEKSVSTVRRLTQAPIHAALAVFKPK